MIRKSGGFTLVELMITMIVFVFVIAGATQVFTGLLTQFKQQGRISETSTQGVAGLEILRRDIAQAGYGLPWDLNGVTYLETTSESGMTNWVDRNYNDGPYDGPARGCSSTTCNSTDNTTCDPGGSGVNCSNPPAPFRSGDDVGITTGSGTVRNSQADLLVIKSATVAMNTASQKWTYVVNTGTLTTNTLKVWNSSDDPASDDQLISMELMDPSNTNDRYILQKDSSGLFNTTTAGLSSSFEPKAYTYEQYVLYDIAPRDQNSKRIRMPFNRADYFVRQSQTDMPTRCAPNTGILYKAVTNNTTYRDAQSGGGGRMTLYPILDCVADFQVVYFLDNANSSGTFTAKGDGTTDWCPACTSCGGNTHTPSPTASPTGDISCLTAYEIRNEVKEVHVYIVAQEGQRDTAYDFSQGGTRNSGHPYFTVTLSDPNNSANHTTLDMVNLQALLCPSGASSCTNEYKYYRWKLYTLVVYPDSMR